MLAQWLTKLDPVHVARELPEREAIYRFRYTVYYEEYGRELGSPDHRRRWVWDEEDEKPYTTLLFTGAPEEVTGTMRLRHWGPGEVPEHDVHELSMDLLPDLAERRVAEIGRLMIRRNLRGRLLLAAMSRYGYDLLCGEQGSDLAFCYCSPGLVDHYRKLGFRTFGAGLVHTPDGIMVPLVNVLSDLGFYRRVGSPLAPVIRRHFGRGKRPALELAPYASLLEQEEAPVEVDGEKVWDELQEAFAGTGERPVAFLDSLPPASAKLLSEKGFLISVEADTLVTREGFGEEEMYLILEGLFEVAIGDRRLRLLGKGELFGEMAFFLPAHKRSATVRSVSAGRVLVLRGETLRRLIESDPTTAARLLVEIGKVMAGRLAAMSRGAVTEEGEA